MLYLNCNVCGFARTIQDYVTKNTFCDGITRVDVPCAEHACFHALKNACYQFKREIS